MTHVLGLLLLLLKLLLFIRLLRFWLARLAFDRRNIITDDLILRSNLGVWAHIGTSTLKQAYLGGIKSVRAQILRVGSS